VTPRIGNAPVSYGVFGTTVEGASPRDLLASVSAAGYDGCELGPPGFFGSAESTAEAFASQGLALVGSYAPIHLAADDATVEADLARIELSCRELVAGGGGLVILADEGSEELLRNPARPWDDRSLALDDAQWTLLGARLRRARDLAQRYGLDTSFHPHISTYVESPWEVERLLGISDVSLTVDIGHVRLAGGDAARCLADWYPRVNHVHIKDASVEVVADARRERRTDFDEWWAGVCTPLGAGDVDIDAVLDVLVDRGYEGWLVVEQDRGPTTLADYPAVADEQAANHTWLRTRWDAAMARRGVTT
jgi:inosose dehydratase